MLVNDYLVLLLTNYILTAAIVCLDTVLIRCCLLNTIIVIIIEFWDFFVVIAMLCTSIGIGYWVLVSLEVNINAYWILGAFLGIVLTLPPTHPSTSDSVVLLQHCAL